jgi:isocitrate dehydrogenase (NAD+)
MKTKVVCIEGDGIGPEVTRAMKRVVAWSGAPIEWVDRPAGLGALETRGDPLPTETLEAIDAHKLAIKGPTNTPKGEGYHSINVHLRKYFDLHVGFRPFLSPPTPHHRGRPEVDLLLFRQNTEGLYACDEELIDSMDGLETRLTARFTSKAMTELAKFAFAEARRKSRKRVTLVTKSNIHKKWGRLYRDAFMAVAEGFPEIEAEEMLVDATSQVLAMNPGRLDVIVAENMFGDILSDHCAGLVGGLGMAPGANFGKTHAIFEAVHGTADDIAGRDLANPVALILSAAMMLDRVDRDHASGARIRKAVTEVIMDGRHVTGDLLRFYPGADRPCTTTEFTDAVCARIERCA